MRGSGASRPGLSGEENASRWDAYGLDALVGRHPLAFAEERWVWERPVYARIIERLTPGARILEVGCGTGANALWFAVHGYDVVGVDFRQPLVQRARDIAQSLGVTCRFETGDAFDLAGYRGFDLAVSFGMIEHWRRSETVSALRQQAAAAVQVVAIVPTPNTRYTAGGITDELFYSRRELRAIFREAGITDITTYSYGSVPSRAYRAAEWLLPGQALKALRTWTLRFSMAHAVLGFSK